MHLNSVDFHQRMIASCDKMLSDLNPEFAEKTTATSRNK